TKAVQEGSGLGLSVVHGIVKAHRGAVTVESEPGRGTTFHVFFPVVKQKVEAREIPAPHASPSGHGRVLLVDDEQLLAEMTAEMLTNAGYRVTVMNHPMDAIDWYGSHASEVDLVITDQTMPDMTGLKMIEELRKLEPCLPVILCTGYSESVTREIVQSLGIKLVMKPVLIQDMVRAIRTLLAEGGPHG
ncbi:MAG: response regulator, partial [Deltaproteobacteria bacterium]|nr:response regulator [Deltaproteobacteria bacterium]